MVKVKDLSKEDFKAYNDSQNILSIKHYLYLLASLTMAGLIYIASKDMGKTIEIKIVSILIVALMIWSAISCFYEHRRIDKIYSVNLFSG